jgi:hypothetical protein
MSAPFEEGLGYLGGIFETLLPELGEQLAFRNKFAPEVFLLNLAVADEHNGSGME